MQSSSLVFLFVGLLVGIAAAWLLANARHGRASGMLAERLAARERELETLNRRLEDREDRLAKEQTACRSASEEVAGLRSRLEAEQRATQEKLDAMIAVEKSLKDSFEALAATALDGNSQRLLQLSSKELEKQQNEANHQMGRKHTAIDEMLRPVRESLGLLAKHSQDLEVKREGAYQTVLAEIRNIQQSHLDLRRETTQLVQALRAPKARGNWGELQLRKCVEFAGMVQYASFDVEKTVRADDASYRPDLIVKMPNGRTIVVDAKTPLDAFLDAGVAEDELVRKAKLVAHAARVRGHLDQLSGKAYWRQFEDSVDFVVCFLPSEVLFSAALEQDPSLIEIGARSNVLLATPTTLIALLKAVAFGWQQSVVAQNARAISETALKAYAKLAGMHEDFVTLGKRLKAAGEAYDGMLTKVEGKGGVFSVSRKLRELGVGEKELTELQPAGLTLRPLMSEDWKPSLSLAASGEDTEPERQMLLDGR